jgi:hypothetical protein
MTAVEWLFDNLDLSGGGEAIETLKQAKEMERKQLQECWDISHQAGRYEGKGIAEENWQTFEDYWNEINFNHSSPTLTVHHNSGQANEDS